MKIYVGNLSFQTSEDAVRELFAQYGTVHSVQLITDRATGRPRGFGFVEMDSDAGEQAIEALNGYELGGRNLNVSQARERAGGERRGGPRGSGGGPRGDRGPRRPRPVW